MLPPGPSRLTVHVSTTRSQASPGPSGAGSHTAPALGAAAPSWPRSGTSSTRSPRFPTLRLRAPGSPRYRSHSDGALVRRTRSSGTATPGPDLDSVLRQRRRENRKKGKGGKKNDQKGDPVILISFLASKRFLTALFSSFVGPFVRFIAKRGSAFLFCISLYNRSFTTLFIWASLLLATSSADYFMIRRVRKLISVHLSSLVVFAS